jgi:hypothetical protein
MAHATHDQHSHEHGPACGHTSIRHEGHVDYIHEGHLHSAHEGHIDEHVIEEGGANPAICAPGHACGAHEAAHVHGPTCGHEAIPHGGHTDYLVNGHLHHPHNGHCDDHGAISNA